MLDDIINNTRSDNGNRNLNNPQQQNRTLKKEIRQQKRTLRFFTHQD